MAAWYIHIPIHLGLGWGGADNGAEKKFGFQTDRSIAVAVLMATNTESMLLRIQPTQTARDYFETHVEENGTVLLDALVN